MADVPPTPPADGPAPRNNRKRKAIGVFLFVLVAMILSGFAFWKYRQSHVSTDDAYIDGRIHLVSARVQGTVVEVRVRDNQPVREGDPLLRIDPEPFAVRESGAASAVAAKTTRKRPIAFRFRLFGGDGLSAGGVGGASAMLTPLLSGPSLAGGRRGTRRSRTPY